MLEKTKDDNFSISLCTDGCSIEKLWLVVQTNLYEVTSGDKIYGAEIGRKLAAMF